MQSTILSQTIPRGMFYNKLQIVMVTGVGAPGPLRQRNSWGSRSKNGPLEIIFHSKTTNTSIFLSCNAFFYLNDSTIRRCPLIDI